MASLTQWRWVRVNSGSWWWTARPGVLQSMGRRESDTTERLNWTDATKGSARSSTTSHVKAIGHPIREQLLLWKPKSSSIQTHGTALSSSPRALSSWSPPANGQQEPVSRRGSFQASLHLQPLRSQTASPPCQRKWTREAECAAAALRPSGPAGQPVHGKERVSGDRHGQSGTITQSAGPFCSLERKQEEEGPESSGLHHPRLHFFFLSSKIPTYFFVSAANTMWTAPQEIPKALWIKNCENSPWRRKWSLPHLLEMPEHHSNRCYKWFKSKGRDVSSSLLLCDPGVRKFLGENWIEDTLLVM